MNAFRLKRNHFARLEFLKTHQITHRIAQNALHIQRSVHKISRPTNRKEAIQRLSLLIFRASSRKRWHAFDSPHLLIGTRPSLLAYWRQMSTDQLFEVIKIAGDFFPLGLIFECALTRSFYSLSDGAKNSN